MCFACHVRCMSCFRTKFMSKRLRNIHIRSVIQFNSTMNDSAIAAILQNRNQGHRDSTYAMLMQLVATNQMPECLHALEQMAVNRIGCWRDVRGFIRHFEQRGGASAADTHSLIQGCVRMTNAQLRQGCAWAAKWVPREPKCRGSPLMMWYYDALAADMFPGAPDAKRRYRKLVSALSPPQTSVPSLAWFVKQAERVASDDPTAERVASDDPTAERVASDDPTAERVASANLVNALWQQHLARHKPAFQAPIPVLSLAHSMGPGHNNCLHAGIGLALYLSWSGRRRRIITFSSQAEVHALEGDDFVSQAQHLLRAARSPLNGLNANLASAATVISAAWRIIVIGDMEHDDDDPSLLQAFACVTWNVSRNGRPATFCGDNPDQMPETMQ